MKNFTKEHYSSIVRILAELGNCDGCQGLWSARVLRGLSMSFVEPLPRFGSQKQLVANVADKAPAFEEVDDFNNLVLSIERGLRNLSTDDADEVIEAVINQLFTDRTYKEMPWFNYKVVAENSLEGEEVLIKVVAKSLGEARLKTHKAFEEGYYKDYKIVTLECYNIIF